MVTKNKPEPAEWSDAGVIGSVAEAHYQEERLRYRIEEFLRSRGWKHTSSTPGSFWMWHKTIGLLHMYVDTEHAMSIERSIEPDDIDVDDGEE